MKIKVPHFLLLSLSITIGCNTKIGNLPVFDLEAAIDNPAVFDVAEIADEIEFIPLDNSVRNGLVGTVSNIKESKTGFYIHDAVDNPVKVFNRSGKFIATRGRLGRGPNEVNYINGIAVDYQTDLLYVVPAWQSLVAYDSDNNIVFKSDFRSVWTAEFFNEELIAVMQRYNTDNLESDKLPDLIDIYSPDLSRKGSITIPYKGLPVRYSPNGNILSFADCFLADNGKSLIIKELLCDTVFHYKDRTLKPVYVFDSGRYAIPAGVWGANPTVPWNEDFHRIQYICEGDSYLIVQTGSGLPLSRYFFIFDRTNASTGGFKPLGPDGKPGLFHDGVKFTPCYIRDNRLVGYMQAIDIVDNAASITNPDLKAIAATLKEDDNPVIVIAKLKQ